VFDRVIKITRPGEKDINSCCIALNSCGAKLIIVVLLVFGYDEGISSVCHIMSLR
jgi:hypothetical protein